MFFKTHMILTPKDDDINVKAALLIQRK